MNEAIEVTDLSPTLEAHATALSILQRVRHHTYDVDGFSNEVYTFSSNVGCYLMSPNEDTPPFVCGTLYALGSAAGRPCNDRSPLVCVIIQPLTAESPKLLPHTKAALWAGPDDLLDVEALMTLGVPVAVGGHWWKLPPLTHWVNSVIVLAPLRLRSSTLSPCRALCLTTRDPALAIQWTLADDVSQIVDASVPFYPGGQALLRCPFRSCASVPGVDLVIAGCDLGTHVDSPSHFHSHLRTVSDLRMDELAMVPVRVIDVKDHCTRDPCYQLCVDDILRHELQHGNIPSRSLVCMRSGWGASFTDPVRYRNTDAATGKMRFPGFSVPAAQFLVEERGCVGIGIDTLSLDVGTSETFDVHTYFLGTDRYQVENMNLESVADRAALYAFVLPLNVVGAFEVMSRVAFVDVTVVSTCSIT